MEHEYSFVVGDYGVRAACEEDGEWYDPDICYNPTLLCRISDGKILGCDGGEPEDQRLYRNWSWIPKVIANEVAINSLELISQIQLLEAKLSSASDELCKLAHMLSGYIADKE